MTARHGLYGCLLCLWLVLAGCQQNPIDTYSDPAFDPGQVRAYAWMPNGSIALGVAPQNLSVLQDTLRSAIDENLQGRGWSLEGPASADVLVRFVVGAESQYEIERTGVTNVAGQETEVPVEVKKLRAGRIAIDLIDARSGQVVWRGVTGGTREGVPEPDVLAETLQRNVRAVFQRL